MFDINFDNLEPAALAKPTKKRIRAYSKEYREWIKPEKKGIKVTGIKPEAEEPAAECCSACGGTGVYKNAKYQRTCFRCKGKGVIDTVQANRNRVYDFHAERGTKERSFEEYNNEGWSVVA